MKKFKLVTLLGIRPDIIRMHKLIKLLDNGQRKHNYEHVFAHTGQHFDYELNDIFYEELGVRHPDVNFEIGRKLKESGGRTDYVNQMELLFKETEEFLKKEKPDTVMFLGDTNSVLASIIVARQKIPVIHIEGGGRSFDWRMPEEKNRIIIDHMSDQVYCYLPRYKEILLREGIPSFRIKVVGNIVDDAIKTYFPRTKNRKMFRNLRVKKNSYILVTLHREENVSTKSILEPRISDLIGLSKKYKVVFPVMPRVCGYLERFGLLGDLEKSSIAITKPLGYLDFLALEANAKVIVTDSGTVQEEALILGTPCFVSRLSTERPETIEAGATIMSNTNLYENTLEAMNLKRDWDRNVLNPLGKSPSKVIFEDIVSKIKSGFFKKSRTFDFVFKDPFVCGAYGK